jgi:hypothetical protein
MNAPNHARLVAIVAAAVAPLAACQNPDAATADSPTKPALTTTQAQALSDLGQMLRRPKEGLSATSVSGGTRVDLQGGFQHAVMVQVNPDGTQTLICTDSIDTATEFLTRGTAVKADEK